MHNALFEAEDSDSDSDGECLRNSREDTIQVPKEKRNSEIPTQSPKSSRHNSVEGEMEMFKKAEVSSTNASPTHRGCNFSQ